MSESSSGGGGRSKPLAAGRRRHHPILARDTGGDNHMFVVRDETRRREVLDREQFQQPPVNIDIQKPIRQIQDKHITDIHEVTKRHRGGEPRGEDTGENPKPRRGWRT